MKTRDVALLSAIELTARYRAGDLSPVDVVRAVFERIETHETAINAFCVLDREAADVQARASEKRWHRGAPTGLLDGVPVSIKDVLLTRGWPTLRGSRTVTREQGWDEDAPAVARLREHGAVLFGKTTTPEFGWKGVTDSPLTGVTRNPWDTTKTPGGSSGGAAAAVLLGMGTLALGTDGGGSVRIPASFCGIVGHKPTFGRVAAYPPSPFGTLANTGPLARTVADAALLMNVIAQPDVRDVYALPYDARDYVADLNGGVAGLRIGLCPSFGGHVAPEVAASVAAAAKIMEGIGARIEPVEAPCENAAATFTTHWHAGAAELLRGIPPERHALLDPGFREVAALGAQIDMPAFFAAGRAREALSRRMNRFFADYDLLMTPTMPLAAFEAGRDLPVQADGSHWIDWSPFTYPFNLSRQPAVSVPCGMTVAGLPVGLQIVGPMYADALVLRAAHAFETACPIRRLEN